MQLRLYDLIRTTHDPMRGRLEPPKPLRDLRDPRSAVDGIRGRAVHAVEERAEPARAQVADVADAHRAGVLRGLGDPERVPVSERAELFGVDVPGGAHARVSK